MRRLVFLMILAIVPTLLHSQIIHESRRTVWSPGIKNGIPAINSPIVNIMDYGADNTGQNSSIPAYDKAIAALPETGGVVFIQRVYICLKGHYPLTGTMLL
jgi:polygalacturonase